MEKIFNTTMTADLELSLILGSAVILLGILFACVAIREVGSDVENIKGTAKLKVSEYTEKTSNACAPNVQMNYLKQK